MKPSEINDLLASKIFDVCSMLLPSGKQIGNYYEIGNIDGDPGKSLKIPLSGSNLGKFHDYASGDHGDLIDLWQHSKGLTFKETISEVKNYLRIADDYSGLISKISKSDRKPQELKSLPKSEEVDQYPEWSKFMDERKISCLTAKRMGVKVYNGKLFFPHYIDGKPVMWHTRSYEKDVSGSYVKKEGNLVKKFGTNKNPVYCLWGWNGIKDSDREVVITEGRIDALSYIEQGIPALSVPCGGGKGGKQSWIDHDFHSLIDHFDKIYLSMDADTAGNDALAEIINRLGDHICWVVNLPDGHNDGSSAHIAGVELKECLKKSKQNTPEGLHSGGEFTEDIIEYFYPNPDKDKSIFLPWEKSDRFKLRLGEVTLLAGENGSGKTQLLGNIMLAGFEQKQIFGIASMEMNPKMLLGRLTKQATTNSKPSHEYINVVSEYFERWLWIYKKKGIAEVPKILKSFLYLNKRYGVRYFVIDSMAKCGINEDDYNGQKKLIDDLQAFSDDNQCHIILVHHMRKKDGKAIDKPQGKSDIKGTGAISDMIDNIIIAWRNRPKEDFLENIQTIFDDKDDEKKYKARLQKMERAPDAILNFVKQRNGDWEGKVPLWFKRNCYQYVGNQKANPYRYINYSIIENEIQR